MTMAVLLFVFGFIAEAVAARKPFGFDDYVILALRKSAKEPIPPSGHHGYKKRRGT
jgi:hypothetical protein